MASKTFLMMAGVISLAAAGAATGQPTAAVKPSVQVHLDAAKALGDKFATMCENELPANMRGKKITTEEARDLGAIPGQLQKPARVFDNLYFLGVRNVSAWAVNTSAGIIMIDSLNNPDEAASSIEGGLRSLGLNPSQIKYVVVTHAHGDHFGGARYLQDKYHARILMSDADWKVLASAKPKPGVTVAPRDMTITDGQKLTLGDETLTFYLTPGHTPGTVSLLIPVKDRGTPHLAALLGGTGPTDPAPYVTSVDHFMRAALAAGADTPMSNHSDVDRVHLKIALLQKRGANDPHPYVTGSECVRLFLSGRVEGAAARAAALVK